MNYVKKFIEKNDNYFLLVIIGLAFAYNTLRNYGLYPSVMDEYVYITNAKLLALKDAQVPDYLYRLIFSITKNCHDGLLDCARFINVLFYVLSTPLIYFISKKFNGKLSSLLISSIAIFSVGNSYTAYFMPESTYYFIFWLLVWCITFIPRVENNIHIWIIGLVLFTLSLIKPHATFLLPPIILYLIYASYIDKSKLINISLKVFLMIFIFIALKTLSKLYFDKVIDISLFGKAYSGMGQSILQSSSDIKALISSLLFVAKGHLISILFLYSVPVASILIYLFNSLIIKKINEKIFVVLTLLIVGSLVIISIGFTAGAGFISPGEIFRIHMRYYYFSLPLLMISGIFTSRATLNVSKNIKIITITPIIFVISYMLFTKMHGYSANYVDGPEIRGLISNVSVMYVFGLINLIICILYVFNSKLSVFIYLLVFQAGLLFPSNFLINSEVRNRLYKTPYDRAALFSKDYLPENYRSKLILLGPAEALGILVLSKIYIDNPDVTVKVSPENSLITRESLSSDKNWVAYVGSYSFDFAPRDIFEGDGFTFIRLPGYYDIEFNSRAWPGIIKSTIGLGAAEGWGRWSSGKQVVINFNYDLPDSFELSLTASPTQKNIGREVTIKAGSKVGKVVFNNDKDNKVIYFKNIGKSNKIYIDIPEPELLGNNNIGIGLGFINMVITPTKLDN